MWCSTRTGAHGDPRRVDLAAQVNYGARIHPVLDDARRKLENVVLEEEVVARVKAPRAAKADYMSVFISYDHKDSIFADRLFMRLRSEGVRAWYDKQKYCLDLPSTRRSRVAFGSRTSSWSVSRGVDQERLGGRGDRPGASKGTRALPRPARRRISSAIAQQVADPDRPRWATARKPLGFRQGARRTEPRDCGLSKLGGPIDPRHAFKRLLPALRTDVELT